MVLGHFEDRRKGRQTENLYEGRLSALLPGNRADRPRATFEENLMVAQKD